ncbi:hypothetical protein MKW98_015018 [Papaver atlanticum]|uniref:Uncharacterized protein n=1 Tax=Papaver atlanticum TaxID=357466 RepID=A0AAD4XAB9_9MAGN|nr:hypothetical protein MKW98_015018 [Papaver atlanticum]
MTISKNKRTSKGEKGGKKSNTSFSFPVCAGWCCEVRYLVVVDDLELEITEDGVNATRLGIVTYNASVRHSDEYTTGIEYT